MPSWAVPRRAESAGALARAAALPVARLGAQLGVLPRTVLGWLRARPRQLLQEATTGFGFLVAIAVTPEGPRSGPVRADGIAPG